ncbi:MAG: restriction endonuclease [Candidatus Omnitrophota bacterium]|nr:restriction endonuclease [Candidatus Omnitrophota bacterium]
MTWWDKIKDLYIGDVREVEEKEENQSGENINKFLVRKLVGLSEQEVSCFLALFKKFAISAMEINLLDTKLANNEQSEKAKEILSSQVHDYIKDFVAKYSNNYIEEDIVKLKDSLEIKGISFDHPNELRAIINIEIKKQSYSEFKNIMSIDIHKIEFSEYLYRFIEIYGLQIKILDDYKKGLQILKTSSLPEEIKSNFDRESIDFDFIKDMTAVYSKDIFIFIGDCIDKSLKISFFKKLLAENNIEAKDKKGGELKDDVLIDVIIFAADKMNKDRQHFRNTTKKIYFPTEIANESGLWIPDFYKESYQKLKGSQYGIYITHFINKYKENWDDKDESNLYDLLKKKGLSISMKELHAILFLEDYEQSYEHFKKLFLARPKDLNETIKMFIKNYNSELKTIKSYRNLAQKFGLIWNEEQYARDLIINTQFRNEDGEEFTIPYYGSIVINENYFERIFFHLKKYILEQGILLKDNNGNEIKNEGLLELIFDMTKTAELEDFERKLTQEKEYSVESINTMNGFEFEFFLKLLFEKMGYKVTRTKLSGDQGADLIIDKYGESTVVQAKRYNSKVSNDAVQEVVASIKHYKAKKGIVITNSEFTNSAIELARSNNITLIDRKELNRLINENF